MTDASFDAPSLPVNYEPHDSLRLGLPAYKEDFAAPHPHPVAAVVAAAASSSGGDDARRMRALADVYGAGLAARHSIEKQILTRPARLSGGPLSSASSVNLGWHALTGALDEFDVGSYLGPGAGVPGQESEEMPADLHSQAEALFKLGTKPARRAT